MSIADDALTIAEKETKLALRFKIAFFTKSMVGPVIRILPFFLVYWGFFTFGSSSSIGDIITPLNFSVFLILGMLADVFFNIGWMTFSGKFMNEKFWQTIEAVLLTPMNKLSLVFGIGLADLISLAPSFVLFIVLCFLVIPIPFFNLLLVLFTLLMLFSISLSMGLIVGCGALFNENFIPFFGYARIVIVFFSCFYYPISVLRLPWLGVIGEAFPLIAQLNPIYQATSLARNIWIAGYVEPVQFIFVLIVSVASPIIAVYLFNKIFKVLSIQGY